MTHARRPAAAQVRARQNVLLENAQKMYFTPVEFQVELLSEAMKTEGGNKIIFVGQDKAFIMMNLIRELSLVSDLRPVTKECKQFILVSEKCQPF